jgi:pyridoxine 5-phosphate synthase
MIALSVNVNKVATLRNSRGGSIPSVLEAVGVCLSAGAQGITVHPREDERHIRRHDVFDIAAFLARERATPGGRRVEFNIEGDPRPSFVEMVLEAKPDQCTLVPVTPGEITSHAGWRPGPQADALPSVIERLRSAGVRVSVFIDPTPDAVQWAAQVRADRVELYTEPFAKAFVEPAARQDSFARYREAAVRAHEHGLGINAGHDLDRDNLTVFRTLPHLDEVSIGHALISHALWVGLDRAVRDYLAAVGGHI